MYKQRLGKKILEKTRQENYVFFIEGKNIFSEGPLCTAA